MPTIPNVIRAAGLISQSILGYRVEVVREGMLVAPSPSWTFDGKIHLHIPKTKTFVTEHEFNIIKGLVFHEVAHLLYPALDLKLPTEFRKSHNILEDKRIEKLLISRYPSTSEWLSRAYTAHIKYGASPKNVEYVLSSGRTHLPTPTMQASKDACILDTEVIDSIVTAYISGSGDADSMAAEVKKMDLLISNLPVKDRAHKEPPVLDIDYSSVNSEVTAEEPKLRTTEHDNPVLRESVRLRDVTENQQVHALAARLKTKAASLRASTSRRVKSYRGRLSPLSLVIQHSDRRVFTSKQVSNKSLRVAMFVIVDTSWSMRYVDHKTYYEQVWALDKARRLAGFKGKTIAFNNTATVLEQPGASSQTAITLPFYERSILTSSLPILAKELSTQNTLSVVIVLSDGDWGVSEKREVSKVSGSKRFTWGLVLVDSYGSFTPGFDKIYEGVPVSTVAEKAVCMTADLLSGRVV